MEWNKFTPLGLAAVSLWLAFGSSTPDPYYPIKLAMAFVALLGGLYIAYRQVQPSSKGLRSPVAVGTKRKWSTILPLMVTLLTAPFLIFKLIKLLSLLFTNNSL